ncbi:serine protease [Pseudoxanthomonas sp. SE1]|uniref:S1 family peptidase n=1 Tax=Pseudoxanthomonas sp. SE1 TaxID=1664560 RepID=UPI00240D3DDB|nr:serine protease [Pseudoxanthomonas sp. SE1]WFC42279.1 serine protease [Pseudoxanthomonas sp. SE1]
MTSNELVGRVESAAIEWAGTLAPFFGNSIRSFVDAEGFGTGFVAKHQGEFFLITADHVVDDIDRYEACVANVLGRSLDVKALRFKRDASRDIAFARLTEDYLARSEIDSVRYFDLGRSWTAWQGTGIYVVSGYPASQNQLKLKFGKTDRHGLNIFCSASSAKPKSALTSYLAFSYDRKKLKNAQGCSFNSPKLNGISGGPCMELMVDTRRTLSFRLVGLVSEFHAKEAVILVSPLVGLV